MQSRLDACAPLGALTAARSRYSSTVPAHDVHNVSRSKPVGPPYKDQRRNCQRPALAIEPMDGQLRPSRRWRIGWCGSAPGGVMLRSRKVCCDPCPSSRLVRC
jgi:hypothetical protein